MAVENKKLVALKPDHRREDDHPPEERLSNSGAIPESLLGFLWDLVLANRRKACQDGNHAEKR